MRDQDVFGVVGVDEDAMRNFAHRCRLLDTALMLTSGATLTFLASWLLQM